MIAHFTLARTIASREGDILFNHLVPTGYTVSSGFCPHIMKHTGIATKINCICCFVFFCFVLFCFSPHPQFVVYTAKNCRGVCLGLFVCTSW